MATILKTAKGKIIKEVMGRVTCSRYEGIFENPKLTVKADVGLWYTMVSGNPFVIEGEGDTPALAIKDSIARTKERIKEMEKGLDSLSVL